jgi:hypothetical protein
MILTRTVRESDLITPDIFDSLVEGDGVQYLHPVTGEVIDGKIIEVRKEERMLEVSY